MRLDVGASDAAPPVATRSEAKQRAADEERRAIEADRRAAEADEERRAIIAEADAARRLAHEQQARLEAEVKEKHRHGIFGEESLKEIVAAADHNTVRFEKYYKGRKFSGVGAFKQAGKASLGSSKDIAITIALRHGEIVCFVNKSDAYGAAELREGSRVSFSGTISATAPFIGRTLQLTSCEIGA